MVSVICVDISRLSDSDYQALYEKATNERKHRAECCRYREDSLRCVAGDALLRLALGNSAYTVAKTELGKPFIQGREDFHFNLSHGGNWAVIAFGSSEVGVDVECRRRDTDIEAVARRYFSPDERQYVFQEEKDRHRRFYEIWTGKESYLKYLGTGLRKSLASFSVFSLEPELRLHRWMLPDGSCLCLCTKDRDCALSLLDLRQLP